MTSRERLACVPEEYLTYYFGKGGMDLLIDCKSCADELHFDLLARQYVQKAPHFMAESSPDWELSVTTAVRDGRKAQGRNGRLARHPLHHQEHRREPQAEHDGS